MKFVYIFLLSAFFFSCDKDQTFDYSAARLYTFGAYTTYCCDNDNDGYRPMVDVWLNIRSNQAISLFAKIYYKPESVSAKLYQLHNITQDFSINYESRYYALTDEQPLDLPHGRYDIMIELYYSADSSLAVSLNGRDNESALPELLNVPIEWESEDGD